MPRGQEREPAARPAERILHIAENVIYAVAGLLLVAGAVIVLVSVAYDLVVHVDDGARASVTTALDGLLLVFILLELLSAIRATIVERKLVAEPFLIVGIIASIKEIVVTAIEAKDLTGARFDDAMLSIAVLGGAILLLAVATFLIRRKEREPDER